MRQAEIVESFEMNVLVEVEKAHKLGVNYWELLKALLLVISPDVMMKSETEYFVKGGK